MAAILETNGVVLNGESPDQTKPGGDHAKLTKLPRHCFAHGAFDYDSDNKNHVKAWDLLQRLFPEETKGEPRVVLSIDAILEPLKEGVLKYIIETT